MSGGPFADSTALIQAARSEAMAVIRSNQTPAGLRAGNSAYPEVWARDAVISCLGLVAAGVPTGLDLLRNSLKSLETWQSPLGRIPNHVIRAGPEAKLQADTMFAGAVDSSLWFIIGYCVLAQAVGDAEEVRQHWDSLNKAYCWLEYQDSNECGLLEVHESMDWADLLANHYNSLLPNILWYWANKSMAQMARVISARDAQFSGRAADIRFKINQLLWVGPEIERDYAWTEAHRAEWLFSQRLVDAALVARPYYLPYMAFRDYGDRFDSLGNLLAVIFGVADERQSASILDYIVEAGVAEPWPVKAFWPVISPGEKDWREYYRQYNLNLPHQYHNGGAWPFLGGFYVAALVKVGRFSRAKEQLVRLAEMNRASRTESEWDFNEWFHGLSGRPMGHSRQSWSAGMFLFAYAAVASRECPLFRTFSD
jgi:glycogen debranching enzyme